MTMMKSYKTKKDVEFQNHTKKIYGYLKFFHI